MALLMILFSIIFCFLIIYVFIYHRNRKRLYELAKQFHGPPTVPIFGNALRFAFCRTDELMETIIKLFKSYPSPMRVWMGPQLFIVFYEPEQIEAILSNPKCSVKGKIYRFMEPLVGKGLISGSGQMWKTHRKIINPTLNNKILEHYTSIFNEQASIFLDCIMPKANGGTFDILEYFETCTIDILCETLLKTKLDAQTSTNGHAIFLNLRRCYESVYTRMVKVWLHPDNVFKYTNLYRYQSLAVAEIQNFVNGAMNNIKRDYSNEIFEDKKRLTTIQKLIDYSNDGQNCSTTEIIDELITMFVAGQDTTALISGFIVLMLGMHPDIQDKVYEESKNIFGNSSRPIEWNDYQRLEYLDMVIKEAVRLFPIAPIMVRYAEDEIQIGKYTVPAGCEMVLAAFVTHRLRSQWEDADKFIPERFLPEVSAKRHPFAYIPFSYGVRSCIGKKFAVLTIKTLIIHTIRLYKIETIMSYEDLQLKSDISVRSKNGYPVKLISR